MRARRRLAVWLMAAGSAVATVDAAGGVPQRAGRAGHFGALAVHVPSGAFGFSYDFRNARDARIAALNHCGHAQCEIVAAVRNGCAAAVANGGRALHALGATRAEAETKAARRCPAKGECKPIGWTCTS